MPVERVRVGVWGLGPHAIDKLLPALAATSRCELVGVTTRDPRVLSEAAVRGGCRSWSSPDEMLADPRVEAIYLSTPTGLHEQHARRSLEAGKHVWCEKSLTHDPKHSLALVEAGRSMDLAVCEAFMYVHHPLFAQLRELITRPAFGELASIAIRFGMPLNRPGFRLARDLGGGAVLDVGCYPILLVSGVLGDVRVRHASANFRDHAVGVGGWAILETAQGVRASLEWGYGLAYRNEAFFWGRGQSLTVERVFSKRASDESNLVVADHFGTATAIPVLPANAYSLMFEALADTVRDRTHRVSWWQSAERQALAMDQVACMAGLTPTPSPRPSTD